jgi:cell division protein FtsQ
MEPPDDRESGIVTEPHDASADASRDETPVLAGVVDIVDIDLTDPDVAAELDRVDQDAVAAGGSPRPRRPAVDPRIRARRIEVAREQGRRRLRVLLIALSVFVVAGTGWLVVRSPMLDVDHIVVTGVPPGRAASIVAASGVHRRDPLLLVSTGAVAHRIDSVPGIGSAQVTRDLPGTLRIHVKELGVALWIRSPAGGVVVVGFDGRVQRAAPVPPPNVIELRGLAHLPAPGGRVPVPDVAGVMRQFPEAFAVRVGAISAASANDVRVYLKVGGEVRLGDFSQIHSKGAVAEAVLERMACAVSYVDVSSVANPVALPAPGAHCNS